MTLIVLGQTGLIGNSLKKYYPNDSLDFSISNWDIENFNAEVSFRINELSKLPDSLDIVWAAGISNNSSNSSIIHRRVSRIRIWIKLNGISYISDNDFIAKHETCKKIVFCLLIF